MKRTQSYAALEGVFPTRKDNCHMADVVSRVPVSPVPEVCVTKELQVGIFVGGAYRLLSQDSAYQLIHRLTDACRAIERAKRK